MVSTIKLRKFFKHIINLIFWKYVSATHIKKGCVVAPWHFEFYILKCKNFWFSMNKAPNVNFLHFTTTDPIYCVTCINVVHNWLEMQKVVTFPLFLMEHPVFIMYIQVMSMRKGKKEKKNFFGYARIRTRGHLDHKFWRFFSTV